MKWVYLTTAPDQLTAELWRNILREEGIPAILQSDHFSYLGTSPFPCRLMVDEERKEEALALIGEDLSPDP